MDAIRNLYIDSTLTRTFVWKELIAHEFYLPAQSYYNYSDVQHRLGQYVLAELPATSMSHKLVMKTALEKIRESDPYLWERLPGKAAFGYTQGKLIHKLYNAPTQLRKAVSLSAAIFNLGIALFDYVLDELPLCQQLFELVTPDRLIELLNIRDERALPDLCDRVQPIGDVEYLLLLCVVDFVERCKDLHYIRPDPAVWDRLSTSIIGLYQAEKTFTITEQAFDSSDEIRLRAMERKSTGPTLTIAIISQLASNRETTLPEAEVMAICDTLGRIFWLVDDLADITKDIQTGTLNYVICQAKSPNQSINREGHYAYIRNGIITTVDQLCILLQRLPVQIDALNVSPRLREEVLHFAKISIYDWLVE